jgi:hypothetical protein
MSILCYLPAYTILLILNIKVEAGEKWHESDFLKEEVEREGETKTLEVFQMGW